MIRFNSKLPKRIWHNNRDVKQMRLNGSTIYDQNHYLDDGLMALLMGDARTNASADKTTWKNLVNGENIALCPNFAWTALSGWTGSALSFDGVDDRVNNKLLPNNIVTVEMVVLKKDNVADGTAFAGGNINNTTLVGTSGFSVGYSGGGGETNRFGVTYNGTRRAWFNLNGNYYAPWTSNIKHAFCVTYNPADSSFYGYFDGTCADKIAVPAHIPINSFSVGSMALNREGWGRLRGEVYALRIYDRYFTAEDVAHNYTIDQEVYGL